MKLIIEIQGTPKKDDLLIFDGKVWKPISQNMAYRELIDKNLELKSELTQLKADINVKLKDFHEVLQLLAKKEE